MPGVPGPRLLPPDFYGVTRVTSRRKGILMTVTEYCLITIALFIAMNTVAMIVIVMRIVPLLNSLETLLIDAATTTKKANELTSELTHVAQDLRRTQARVTGVVSVALDQIEPPVHQAAALIAGVRAGLGALLGNRNRR